MIIELTVNGRRIECDGDVSVAAALLNAGISAFRTTQTGEPRAPLCGMGTCFECRVTIDGVAGQRACLVTARDGMNIVTDDQR